MENVRNQLNRISSLNYRLEILENVYSLIYMTAHDLKNDEDQTSDEDDNNEAQKLPGLTAPTKNEIFIEQQMNNESVRSEFEIIKSPNELGLGIHEEFSIYSAVESAEEKKLKAHFNYRSRSDFGESLSQMGSMTEIDDDEMDGGRHENRKRSLLSLYRRNAGGGGSFLVNDYLCRDILLLVNDLLLAFSFKQAMPKLEDSVTTAHCSISIKELVARASKLQQVVGDTLWRYQLVKPDVVSLEYGVLDGLLVDVDGNGRREQETEVYELMKKRKQMETHKKKNNADSYLAFSMSGRENDDSRKILRIR